MPIWQAEDGVSGRVEMYRFGGGLACGQDRDDG